MRFALRRAGIVTALVTLSAVLLIPAAAAAPVNINYDCRANTPAGAQMASLAQTVDASAPATVAPGGALSIVVDPAPNQVPSSVNGFTVSQIKNIALKVPVPANSTFVRATLTGGSGLGPTPPTLSQSSGVITISIAGPINGGATFELPTVTTQLTAGQSGTIRSTLGGTSFDNPGLTFTTVIRFLGTVNAPTSCFPNPNPVLTTTTIG